MPPSMILLNVELEHWEAEALMQLLRKGAEEDSRWRPHETRFFQQMRRKIVQAPRGMPSTASMIEAGLVEP